MGCLVVIIAVFNTLFEALGDFCAKIIGWLLEKHRNRIDFANIASVTLDKIETAYRTETEEEFDPVMSDFLTQQDGWQHYETQTVEYEVEDGYNYFFTIRYHNGKTIHRRFHSSSPLTQRLLAYCD